jgi:hypothetical protein
LDKQHRAKKFFLMYAAELSSRCLAREEVITQESARTSSPPLVRMGLSHAIVLRKPAVPCGKL